LNWALCRREVRKLHFKWWKSGIISTAITPEDIKVILQKSETLIQLENKYYKAREDFYKEAENRWEFTMAHEFGTQVHANWMPCLWKVYKGVVEKFYSESHSKVCSMSYECPLQICPEVEQAAYYCTSAIVSETYFSNETQKNEIKASKGWLRRALRGVREVHAVYAFKKPSNAKERTIALQAHYAVWRQCGNIISYISFIFDLIIAIERVRDSCIKKMDEDYKKIQIVYASLAQEDMRYPTESSFHSILELKLVHTAALLFVKDSFISRQAIIHSITPMQENHAFISHEHNCEEEVLQS